MSRCYRLTPEAQANVLVSLGLCPETLLYAIALAVFAALIVGVIPALKATGAHLQGRLREAGAGGSTMKFGRLWTGVIVTQVAITVIFVATLVSLRWTTYRGRHNYDVTFAREQFLTARLVLDQDGAEAKADAEAKASAYDAGPEVAYAALISEL